MNLSTLQGEERLFLRRLEDLFRQGGQRRRFSPFLDERQLDIARSYVDQAGRTGYLFYGGYSDAVRMVLGVFPPHAPQDTAHFPVTPIVLAHPEGAGLSHRDFLGALMNLRITRESIGDIVAVDGTRTALFVLEPVSQVVLQELKKVGRTGVRCTLGLDMELTRQEEFGTLHGTVSSLRLDSLVSLLAGISREKGAALVKAEQVKRNHTTETAVAREFGEGDVISIRGHGKFVVDKIGGPTRKGRLPVDCRKYK